MPLSQSLKDKLHTHVFVDHSVDSTYSKRQHTAVNTGFYSGKISQYPDGFNYNYDLQQENGMRVYYGLTPMNGRLSPAEQTELNNACGANSNYCCQLRIIIQNQRKSRRNNRSTGHTSGHKVTGQGKYPKGQTGTVITPGHLSDVGSILGVRGTDVELFGQYMLTWPPYPVTGYPGWIESATGALLAHVNNLNEVTGNFFPTGGHTHPRWNSPKNYTAGGYPAIINRDNSQLCDDLDNQTHYNLDNGLVSSPTYVQQHTAYFNYNSSLNQNFHPIGYDTCQVNMITSTPTTGATDYNPGGQEVVAGHNQGIGTYEYKQNISYTGIMNGGSSSFFFPIIFHAYKTLKRRNYSTKNIYLPDCFNYTVALVFYQKKSTSKGNKWVVYDVVCDRLRTIDRGDIERGETLNIPQNGSLDTIIHPNLMIRSGGAGYTPSGVSGNTRESIFPNVPKTFIDKYFNGYGSTTGTGIDGYSKTAYRDGLKKHIAIINGGATRRYFMPLGTTTLADSSGNTYNNISSIKCAYNSSTKELTIRVVQTVSSGTNYLSAYECPTLVGYE